MSVALERAGRVLVVDDTEEDRRLLNRLLTAEGYTVTTAADGLSALRTVSEAAPDIILLDVMMPGMTGFEVCQRLKGNPATRLIPVVLVTSLSEREDKIQGINAGADDFMSKPANPHELRARVRSLVRLKHFTDELDFAESVIESLAMTIEARDPYTGGHCERVAAYAAALGVQLDLADEDVAALHRGGFLHDVGKVAVPDAVLLKAGPLTPDEATLMRQHPLVGDRLCGQLHVLRAVRPIVRWHHERLDGSGYPDGLAGDRIPLLAQVFSIADACDALTTDRPYRPALSRDAALQVLREEAARGLRRGDLVDAFVNLAKRGRLDRLADLGATISPAVSLLAHA